MKIFRPSANFLMSETCCIQHIAKHLEVTKLQVVLQPVREHLLCRICILYTSQCSKVEIQTGLNSKVMETNQINI